MDTITQITLGAAVGEAVLGKKIGNKAPAIGAVLGVLPDLDILANPFLNEVQKIAVHRGITHSLLFAFLASPLIGWGLSKLFKRDNVPWLRWIYYVFGILITHILIDLCTSYGTQIFQPFSDRTVTFNSIFIIDPFYTLPLFLGLVTSLFYNRISGRRRIINYSGLAISSIYLIAGFVVKSEVNKVYEQNFREQEITVDRYMTSPAPFSIFLWTGYAESGDTIYAGLYSVFDDDPDIAFHPIKQNEELLNPYRNQLPVRRLIWFSDGYYSVSRGKNRVLFHDLRFGRSDLWLTDREAPFVWNYRLRFNEDSTEVVGVRQFEPSFETRNNMFGRLVDRILGNEPVIDESIQQY